MFTIPQHRSPRRLHLFVALSTILLLASCDAVLQSDPVTLPEKEVTFRFEFNMQGVEPGQTLQVTSEEAQDLGPQLDDYTKAEVISATVTRVELERVSPPSVDLSILDEAILAFTATNVQLKTIANSAALPSNRTASLPVSTSPDATSFVIAPSFRGSLTIVPQTVPDGTLVLRTTVTFRIEVEGV